MGNHKADVSFSDIDEETDKEMKVWMQIGSESKLVTVSKNLLGMVEFGACEAKYFVGANTKFMDRSCINESLQGICGRKTTRKLSYNGGPERCFCRWHIHYLISDALK